MSATPHLLKSVERPVSRLSKRITWKPRAASPWNSESGQMVSCAPRPMTSNRAGSLLLPAVSYSISMPFALTLATLALRPMQFIAHGSSPWAGEHSRQPAHRRNGGSDGRLPRGIGGTGMVCNRRPQAGILDVAPKHLEAEASVGPPEKIDAAVVLGILDALQDNPRL